METVSTFILAGMTVRIFRDPDPGSPDGFDNDDVFLVGFHRDFHVVRDGLKYADDIRGWSRDYHVFALNAYIHGGVRLSLGGFGDPWDSGQVGYVLVKRLHCFKNKEKAREVADGLVSEWNQYLDGDVYGYTISEACDDGNEHEVDSLWGIYGEDVAETEARTAARSSAKQVSFDFISDGFHPSKEV